MHSLAAHTAIAASGSFLITPNVGLMIWTLVVFVISLYILRRAVFPRIGEALDKRAQTIDDSIDAAAQMRAEAETVLSEYRERLNEARWSALSLSKRTKKAAR